jgi:3-methylcrotonyl-CoA carboxylase alpha subunit
MPLPTSEPDGTSAKFASTSRVVVARTEAREIRRVLVANRGEIACRVIRSCKALGLATIAIYSEADAEARHVHEADEAYFIGASPARDSYLDASKVIAAAIAGGADAVHPGYGFLSENAEFALAVEERGLVWIGPNARTIRAMGDKERARQLAAQAGVPTLPGSGRFGVDDLHNVEAAARAVGYPLLVKASAGGGGIGMRRVDAPEALIEAVKSTQSMAGKAFGDSSVYVERYVARARHIEVQVFGDGHGHVVHLHDRECSIQRRFQKIVEEAPAPRLPDATREAVMASAVQLAAAQRYASAGTVEFVVDDETGKHYFLEMNTRIQVEHPVTEMVTGRDIVAMQLELAAGRLRMPAQAEITLSGHAIECRLYAENPARNFLPSPGRLNHFSAPKAREGVRVDSACRSGDTISVYYDPMIAKIIAHGPDRASAIARMSEALAELSVEGIATNAQFLRAVFANEAYARAEIDTGFVPRHLAALLAAGVTTGDVK